MAKSLDQAFVDWEESVFGFGYGSGEEHVIKALRVFFEHTPPNEAESRCYDYTVFEKELGGSTAWLLLNALGHADIIEYGSSPRFGWLTEHGYRLRSYILSRKLNELLGILAESTMECQLDCCNCDESTGVEYCKNNPFSRAFKAVEKEQVV